VAECRDVLEIDSNDHDSKINMMLSAAISAAESFTKKFLAPRTIQLSFDEIVDCYRLPVGPVNFIVTAEAFINGSYQPFIDYLSDLNDDPPLVSILNRPNVDPDALNRLRFTLDCGYQVAQVPGDIKQAILFHVYQSFLIRGGDFTYARNTFKRMLYPYRTLGL